MENTGLHWIDYSIVIGSILFAIGIGYYFAHRQKGTEQYFAGGRNIPSWAIGMSIFATLISSVTFLAYPGSGYAGDWILLVQGLMVPIVLVCIIGFIVPLFRRVIRLSVYEYFEKRFGRFARFYGSSAFVLGHFSKMGTVLFLVSLAMSRFMNMDIILIIVVLGIAVTALTLMGGIEAVIWMDVIQGFLLILGGVICISILLFRPENGIQNVGTEIVSQVQNANYSWNFVDATFWVLAFNGIFYALQKYGTDQTIVQRYITAKDDKSAKKAAYIGVFTSLPVWTLFMVIGIALIVFYRSDVAHGLPEGLKADEVFPYFISTQLPVGIKGLIIAALAAGAISSLDSDINCLAAIGVQDYYLKLRPKAEDKRQLQVGRYIVFIAGFAAIGVSMLYAIWEGEGVLGVVFQLYAIFSAGIVGILLLGLFSKRANKKGLYWGIAAAMAFTAYAMLTSTPIGVGANKRILLDLGALNYTHHKLMLGVYSHIVLLVVGYVASLFYFKENAPEELTIHGYLRMKKEEKLNKKTAVSGAVAQNN